MKAKSILYLMVITILSACSDKKQEETIAPVVKSELQSVTFAAANTSEYSIIIFRETNSVFLYQQTLYAYGAKDSKLTTELPTGNYKFLFALHYGRNIQLTPELKLDKTAFSELKFIAQTDPANDQFLLDGDELFLPVSKADTTYKISGPSTIKCTLTRAVSQVLLYIKRGQKAANGVYIPIEYTKNENILQFLSGIQLSLQQAGTGTDVNATTTGQGNLLKDFDLSHPDTLTTEGFAVYKGPFFFPAQNNGEVTAKITLSPATGSPQPILTTTVKSSPVRNQQLVITVWITKDWNFVGVTADTQAISKEADGIQGLWDDQVN